MNQYQIGIKYSTLPVTLRPCVLFVHSELLSCVDMNMQLQAGDNKPTLSYSFLPIDR